MPADHVRGHLPLEMGKHGARHDIRPEGPLDAQELIQPERVGDFIVVDEGHEVCLFHGGSHGGIPSLGDPPSRFRDVSQGPWEPASCVLACLPGGALRVVVDHDDRPRPARSYHGTGGERGSAVDAGVRSVGET